MSQANVDLIRSLIPPPEADLAALFRSDELFGQTVTALERVIDPDVETLAVWRGVEGEPYKGIDGFRRLWLDWLEPWSAYHSNLDELIDAGDRVVALVRDRGRREGIDAEVEVIAGSTWEIRDGKITRVAFYGDRGAALAAAGIEDR